MKNRFVRWAIYFAIGIAIGIGVSFYQRQMDEGVVELTSDDMQEGHVEIPNREEAIAIGTEALQEAEMAIESVKDAVIESTENIMPVDEHAEESTGKETMIESMEEAVETVVEETADARHEAEAAVKIPPATLTPMPE